MARSPVTYRPLVIIGAGGFGREILDVIDAARDCGTPRASFRGFLDDGEPDETRIEALGELLLGPTSTLETMAADYLIGVGNPMARRDIDAVAASLNRSAHPATVHRSAAIGRSVDLGPGSVVCAQAVITTNVVAGRHLHLNLCSTIGHDCSIGDFVTIAPGVNISGNVSIGECVEFGTGAKVLPGINIGAGATVGAGAVVVRDVQPGETVVGVPARPMA